MSALLARSAQATRNVAWTRSFHASRTARSAHAKHELVPFSYKSPLGLALRISAFFVIPFSLPFATAAWQLSKGKADA